MFFSANDNGTNFEIEKITGITVSQLFVDELLRENTLVHILRSINRIHNTEITCDTNVNIYENYSNKLKDRYTKNQDIYKKFPDSSIVYNELVKSLKIMSVKIWVLVVLYMVTLYSLIS